MLVDYIFCQMLKKYREITKEYFFDRFVLVTFVLST